MEKAHRDILRKNAVVLTKEMEVTEEFLSLFITNSLISDSNREELLLPQKTSTKKATEFQMMIVKKGPRAFGCLVQALVFTGQLHIAEKLDPQLTAFYKKQLGVSDQQAGLEPVHMQETTPPITGPTPFFGNQRTTPASNENVAIMTIGVQPVSLTYLRQHAQSVEKGTAYNVKSWPRGNFVIINNEYFHTKSERQGSKFDVTNLRQLSDKLEFRDVVESSRSNLKYENLKGEEMKRELIALSKCDYSDHDALIITIMSHGANGIVYGVDGVAVSIEEDICAPFDGKRCPTLSGKPKIFIIQACQGDGAVTGVPQADDDQGDAHNDSHLNKAFRNLKLGDTGESMPIKIGHKIPHKSDMLVAYSTVRGYRSWRRPDLGSWFIRAIVTVFSQHAHEEDVQSLFTMVKNKVSAEKTNYAVGDEYIQMPRTDDTLRKKWFFLPGHKENQRVSQA